MRCSAVDSSLSHHPVASPEDWLRLGDLLQVIAGHGDHMFLAMLAKQAEYHIALVLASQMLPPG
jgi:hypothetical protein